MAGQAEQTRVWDSWLAGEVGTAFGGSWWQRCRLSSGSALASAQPTALASYLRSGAPAWATGSS